MTAHRSITVRITAGFVLVMAVLLLATGAFVYERMRYALDRSIRDVPTSRSAEIHARRVHRDEALAELLVQLSVAFGGALLLAGYVGYRTARAALDPVDRMREQASTGALESGLLLTVPSGDDELSRLAETLNGLLRRLHEAAERERRLLADASHELRTPLSHLQLEIDLALSRRRSAEELTGVLRRLRDETARLTRLANDLLLLARAAEGALPLRREPVDLAQLAERVRRRFAETANAAGRSLVVRIAPETVVDADRDRLEQAMGNLVDNAIRHGGGRVVLESVDGEEVAIHVRDEGAGFPAGFVEAAFGRFTTGSRSRADGSGLGLAIVEAIASSHGGRVGATTRGGADVWLTVPRTR